MNSKWSIIVSPKDYLSVSTGTILTVLKKFFLWKNVLHEKVNDGHFPTGQLDEKFGYASPHQVSSPLPKEHSHLRKRCNVRPYENNSEKHLFTQVTGASWSACVFFRGSLFLYPVKRGRMEKGIIYFTAPHPLPRPVSPLPTVHPQAWRLSAGYPWLMSRWF